MCGLRVCHLRLGTNQTTVLNRSMFFNDSKIKVTLSALPKEYLTKGGGSSGMRAGKEKQPLN